MDEDTNNECVKNIYLCMLLFKPAFRSLRNVTVTRNTVMSGGGSLVIDDQNSTLKISSEFELIYSNTNF